MVLVLVVTIMVLPVVATVIKEDTTPVSRTLPAAVIALWNSCPLKCHGNQGSLGCMKQVPSQSNARRGFDQLLHLPCKRILRSNSEAIRKFRLELQLLLHFKKFSLVDFFEVVAQVSPRTEGRVADEAHVVSHPPACKSKSTLSSNSNLCCLRWPR